MSTLQKAAETLSPLPPNLRGWSTKTLKRLLEYDSSACHSDLPLTQPVAIFLLVLLIILVCPIVFKRLKIPQIVGLILSGVVVGLMDSIFLPAIQASRYSGRWAFSI